RLDAEGLVQLGHGVRQRRLLSAQTDRTSALAEAIARDRELTRTLLQAGGVPVPRGRLVASAGEAWEIAQELGGPVVIKPQYGSRRRGICKGLHTREQVLKAHARAAEECASVLVEQQTAGADWRLLVVGERVVAAARRQSAEDVTPGVHPEVALRAVDAARM